MSAQANSLRLKLRDLAAAAAFASMALSGALPIWATVGFGVGLTLAVLGVRVLGRQSNLTAFLLTIAAVLLYASAARGGLDLVVAASLFAALIAVCRMLAQPDAKTDGQVLLMSFLMLAAGAALSADVLFAVALAAFAVLAMVATGLSVVVASGAAGEAVSIGPLLRQLAVGAAFALVGSALLFACLPRFSWQLATRRGPLRGQSTSGLSEGVSLSGSGRIKVNPRIVARVRLDPDPRTPTLEGYWLGRTFDTFDGTKWQSRGARRRVWGKVRAPSGGGPSVHQWVELLPGYGARTVFALQWPAMFSAASARTAEGGRPALFIEQRGQEIRIDEAAPAYSYQADSMRELAGGGALAPTGDRPEYLQLPAELDPRIVTLAQSAAGPTGDAIEAAHNLERFLQRNYSYSLEPSDDVRDPLAQFLFVTREGHCEQFATALTVMLRALGIPARLATGFFGGERVGNQYVIRAGDAHAWTHLILPDGRLISLDPTPEASRAAQAAGALDWLARVYETLSERWRNSVVDYSLQDQADLATWVRQIPRRTIPPGALLGLALLGALLLWRWAKRRRPAVDEATAMLQAAERILAQAGVATRRGECVEDVARRLAFLRHPISPALTHLTKRYLEARFGRRPLRPRERARLIRHLAATHRSTRRSREA